MRRGAVRRGCPALAPSLPDVRRARFLGFCSTWLRTPLKGLLRGLEACTSPSTRLLQSPWLVSAALPAGSRRGNLHKRPGAKPGILWAASWEAVPYPECRLVCPGGQPNPTCWAHRWGHLQCAGAFEHSASPQHRQGFQVWQAKYYFTQLLYGK